MKLKDVNSKYENHIYADMEVTFEPYTPPFLGFFVTDDDGNILMLFNQLCWNLEELGLSVAKI